MDRRTSRTIQCPIARWWHPARLRLRSLAIKRGHPGPAVHPASRRREEEASRRRRPRDPTTRRAEKPVWKRFPAADWLLVAVKCRWTRSRWKEASRAAPGRCVRSSMCRGMRRADRRALTAARYDHRLIVSFSVLVIIFSFKKITKQRSGGKRKSAWYQMLNPTYRSRCEDFKRIFKDLPVDERLIVDYSCALQRDILLQGRIYVTQNYLCFYANIFRWETLVNNRNTGEMSKRSLTL